MPHRKEKQDQIGLVGKSDSLKDPSAGLVALRLAPDGAIFTRPHGSEEVAVGGVSGLGGCYVLDASGLGDFTTFAEARAGTQYGDTILVFGTYTSDTVDYDLTGRKWVGIGAKLTGSVQVEIRTGGEPTEMYGFEVELSRDATVAIGSNVSATIRNCNFKNITTDVVGAGLTVGECSLDISDCRIVSKTAIGANVGVLFGDGAMTDLYMSRLYIDSSDSMSTSGGNLTQANIYHCVMTGAAPATITVHSSNHSNIASGVTWPAIP